MGLKRLVALLLVLVALAATGSIALKIRNSTTSSAEKIATLSFNTDKPSSVYIVNTSFMKNSNLKSIYHILCSKMKRQSFQVVLYRISPKEKREFLKLWLKALGETGHRLTVIPVSRVSKDKRSIEFDKRLLRADIVVLSCKPEGIFVVKKTDNPSKDIHFIEEMINKIRIESTNIKNFKYIGYIGWKTKSVNNIGKETVDVDYYIAKTNINGKTYRFFLAIPHHSAIGYNGYSPKEFTTVTDWNTKIWPGQVLHDWGPKNEGSNAKITYTLTASAGVQGEEPVAIASATISYSVPGGLVIKWADQTSPDTGCVKTLHKIPNSKSGVTYTVEPSSIGLLDPTKQGGFLPMIVDHDFKVELQKPVFLWWTDTKTIDINFTAALYDSNVLNE